MARESLNLIDDLAVIQGETYQLLLGGLIWFPGDLSAGICRGHIRNEIVFKGGELITAFQFESSLYDADKNITVIRPYLSETQTIALEPTLYQGDRQPSSKNCYVYDIEIELDGVVFKNPYGLIQVIGEVTNNDEIYNPPIVWDGSVDHISLTNTNGLIKTYTVWGDAAETLNLGTFAVEDGNGIASSSYDALTGILTITFVNGGTFQTGDLRATLTAAEIKTRYESNPNTNVFTDAEKNKLLVSIENGGNVSFIRALTQIEYDLIVNPDPGTLYFITP